MDVQVIMLLEQMISQCDEYTACLEAKICQFYVTKKHDKTMR